MNIVVCIKQVPDTMDVRIDPKTNTLVRDGVPSILNPFDEFAVEEALRIKAAFPGTTVEAISVGPSGAADILRRALAMGADSGTHILHEGEPDPLPGEVAALIAAHVRGRSYDLILAGVMAEDGMHAQTGPMLAEQLEFPCATAVMAETISPDGKIARVERELEGGRREALEMPLPALITVQSGINRPRYPALSHVLRSRTQPLTTLRAEALPVEPRRERVVRITLPAPSGKALFLKGTAQEKAERLADLFREKALL
jgi:electron transfer flavoprotein beta subunit